MKTLTVGSLFSGIGGFDLGLEQAGMEIKWQVEIDERCREDLKRRFPGSKQYEDIRKAHGVIAHADGSRLQEQGAELETNGAGQSTQETPEGVEPDCPECLEPVDIICGGFPCQPFSNAGKQRGTEDDRYLWPEMLRIIKELKPRWIIGENVAGLVNMGEQDGDVTVANKTVVRSPESDIYSAVWTHEERMLLYKICQDIKEAGYELAAPIVIPACAASAPHRRDRIWIMAHANGG